MIDARVHLRAMLALAVKAMAIKTYDRYRSRLWGAMQRLWNGGRDANFLGSFARSIDQQLTEAWNKGADSVGVAPDEMSQEDTNILDGIIRNENDFIQKLADDIQALKDGGGKDEQFQSQFGSRVDLWANRYIETENRSVQVFGTKERLMWVEGDTVDKCEVCKNLDGIVAFGWEWDEAAVNPQMPPNENLPCGGWGCHCKKVPTTERRTPKALSRILDIITAQHI